MNAIFSQLENYSRVLDEFSNLAKNDLSFLGCKIQHLGVNFKINHQVHKYKKLADGCLLILMDRY